MRLKICSLLLSVGFIFGIPLDTLNMRLVGTWPFGGDVTHIETNGNNIIFASLSCGILVYQIGGNFQLTKLAEIHVDDIVNDLYYHSGKLFVSSEHKITIWDVSRPDSPYLLSTINYQNGCGLAADDGHLYIVNPYGGLNIYDISNPSNPSLISSANLGQYLDIELIGQYLLATSSWNGSVTKIDVSNPTNPQIITTTQWSNTEHAVKLFYPGGNYVFVAGDNYGLVILDITHQDTVPVVSSLSTNDAALDVFVFGIRAFVASNYRGLAVVNITNPASPQLELEYNPGYGKRVTCVAAIDTGNLIFGYSTDDGGGLFSLTLSANPVINQQIILPGDARNIAFSGDYAYVATGKGGIRFLNISNPSCPYEILSYAIPETTFYDVAVNGNVLYCVDDGGVRVLDVSVPTSPQLITHVGADNFNFYDATLHLYQNYLYLVSPLGGLLVFDVSNPAHPILIGSFYNMVRPNHIYVNGTYGYITDGGAWYGGGGIRIINLTNPSNPVQDTVLQWGSSYDIDGAGNTVFSLTDNRLLSFTSGNSPQLLDSLWIGGVIGIDVADTLVAVTSSNGQNKVSLINASDPQNISIVGYYTLPGPVDPRDVAINDGYIYVADADYGVWILEYTQTSVREEPNFSPTVISHDEILNLQAGEKAIVFDVTGRRIKTIQGRSKLNLPSGIYLIRVVESGKILRLLVVK